MSNENRKEGSAMTPGEWMQQDRHRMNIAQGVAMKEYAEYYHSEKAKEMFTESDMLNAFSRKIGIQTLHENSGKTWITDYKNQKHG